MKRNVLGIIMLITASSGLAQDLCDDPLLDSWMVNTDGQMADYNTDCCPSTGTDTYTQMEDSAGVQSVWYDDDNVYINATSLPFYTMGTWATALTPVAQELTWRIPRAVTEDTSGDENTAHSGTIGVAVNGVGIFSETSSRSYDGSSNTGAGYDIWNQDAWVTEGYSMDDAGGGHPTSAGYYHYHATPFALYTDASDGHSPIVGWGLDGVPIYGPYGYSDSLDANSDVVRMESSYQLRDITERTVLPDGTEISDPTYWGPDVTDGGDFDLGIYAEDNEYVAGLGHLDDHNGRWCVTPEYPEGVYAYFITIDEDEEPQYPYIIGPEYYGETQTGSGGYANVPNDAVEFDSTECEDDDTSTTDSTEICDDQQFTSWLHNTDGSMAMYNELTCCPGDDTETFVQLDDSADIKQLYYTDDYIYVLSNGLSSDTMGTWPLLAAGNAASLTPSAQDHIYRIPRNPAEETGSKTEVPSGGPIAYAIDGIPMYGYESAESYNGSTNANGGYEIWNSDAWVNEGQNMDDTRGAHADGTGMYHYHATPFALYTEAASGHSPIVGWAPDGYPIYGPYGYNDSLDANSTVTRMVSSYGHRDITERKELPDGTVLSNPSDWGPDVSETFPIGTYIEDYEFIAGSGHLDAYNGRWCVTPEFPEGTYAYFITIDEAEEPAFPYIFAAEYYGVVEDANNIGTATVASGATLFDATSCSSATCSAADAPVVSGHEICSGSSVTLSISSGDLNDATQWVWYTGSCDGTEVGTGTSIEVSPESTTSYYVKGEGSECDLTTCTEVEVKVDQLPTVDAGDNIALCIEPPNQPSAVDLSGTISDDVSGTWSSENAGLFTPDATDLNASYRVSQSEVQAGEAILTLTADANACGTASDELTITIDFCTSIAEMVQDAQFQVYPNPASEMVQYQVTGLANETVTIVLYDLTGTAVKQVQQTVDGTLIGALELPATPGIYLLEMASGSQVQTTKLIVR